MKPDLSAAEPAARFAAQSTARRPTLAGEFIAFLKHNKKWWMAPILGVLVLLGGIVLIGGSGAAPFIYTLF